MFRVHIDAKPDHVLRLARRNHPQAAVAEMIWNALDAEAGQVEVEVQTNDIGGVERVIVRDDGHGMLAASCGTYLTRARRPTSRSTGLIPPRTPRARSSTLACRPSTPTG
jgi:hypothetical protein